MFSKEEYYQSKLEYYQSESEYYTSNQTYYQSDEAYYESVNSVSLASPTVNEISTKEHLKNQK